MPIVAGDLGHITWHNNANDQWTAYAPTILGLTATASLARYKQVGKTVHVVVVAVATSGAGSTITVSMPVNAAFTTGSPIVGAAYAFDAGTTGAVGAVQIASATTFSFIGLGGNAWGATVPHTWAATDTLRFTATYESV